ncbi:hypothetical protein TIFTF001_028352 [Ficus carica]|uniref:Uncharacterized protein n=1 Tax=Ficus carica TaxID=3494 RepID=A0AA88J1C2_FICCA|nr:hypothetical protein TIFTF001_028352 [Ficus carica]
MAIEVGFQAKVGSSWILTPGLGFKTWLWLSFGSRTEVRGPTHTSTFVPKLDLIIVLKPDPNPKMDPTPV